MIEIVSEVNGRLLSPGCTPSHGEFINPPGKYESVGDYRGWAIRGWTGWKGNTAIIEPSDIKRLPNCEVCGKHYSAGDKVVWYAQSDRVEHCNCSEHPIKGQIVGQWLAFKPGLSGSYEDAKYAVACVPGTAGAYKRGAEFDISVQPGQSPCTPDTPQDVLEAAREDGFVRLKKAIDAIEDAAA
jgi:hypothetical protein